PVVSSLIWATLTPFLLLAANYLAVKTPNRARNIGFLIVAAIFFGVLRVVVGAFTYYLFDPTFKTDWSRIVNAALVRSHGEILMAATIFAFVVVRDLYLDSREREGTGRELAARP